MEEKHPYSNFLGIEILEATENYAIGRVEAEVRHRGSRTCIVAVELTHEDESVVCDGQFSYSKI